MNPFVKDNFFLKLIMEMVYGVIASVLNFFGVFINDIFSYILLINQTSQVIGLTTFSSIIGIALIAILVIKQLINTYGTETEGDPDRDPLTMLYRVGKCVAVIGCNSWLFVEIMRITNALNRDINKVIHVDNNISDIIKNLMESSLEPAYMLCMLAIVIGLLLFVFQAGRRGAELSLSRILLPIFAIDLLNSNPEKWNMFFFQYLVNFFGYLIQMICFRFMVLFLSQLNAADITDFVQKFIITMGWMTMAIKVPQWLEKYIYTSGVGRTVSNGASRLSQIVMYCKAGR